MMSTKDDNDDDEARRIFPSSTIIIAEEIGGVIFVFMIPRFLFHTVRARCFVFVAVVIGGSSPATCFDHEPEKNY